MSENTKIWDQLGRTDPAHTSKFKRGGGFSGTAIKPIWSFRRMTEMFGACGLGWGVGEPTFQVVPGHEGEVLVYCTASIWFAQGDEASRTIYGVGGDKVVAKNKYGLTCNDEAFKAAYTDALTNALKLIGVGADVHMGRFDDSKYVRDMEEEFSVPPAPPSKSSAQLKRDGAWEKMMLELSVAILDCKSLVMLSKLRADLRERARAEGWNRAFLEALKDELDQHEDRLTREAERQMDDEAEAARINGNPLVQNYMAG